MVTTTNQPAATNGNVQQAQQNGVQKQESLIDNVLRRITDMQSSGELKLPANYSAVNALRAAWLILQEAKDMNKNYVLEACTKPSIKYALLNMVLQGLNPAKRQCSFIAYGNKLTLQREYQGTIAIAKRVGLKSVIANAIFDGDEFAYEVEGDTGRKKVTKHVQTIDSLGNAVKGAYAIVTLDDGTVNVEVMNIRQIQQAWQQGPTKGQSPAHKNFPDQMACKTVIGRSLKTLINSSDDAALFEDDEPLQDAQLANVQNQIAQHANKNEIGFSEASDGENRENDNAGTTTNVDKETGEVTSTETNQEPAATEPAQQAASNQQATISNNTSQQPLGPGF